MRDVALELGFEERGWALEHWLLACLHLVFSERLQFVLMTVPPTMRLCS